MRLFSDKFPDIRTQAEFDAFATGYPQFDTGYLFQATVLGRRNARDWIEQMWQKYEPYADSHFSTEFKTQFTQRVWELYLGATIINRGFDLGQHSDEYPDLDVRDDVTGRRVVWIEAVAVTKGTGPDKVPEMQLNVATVGLPDEEMSLRLTQALKGKYDQYLVRVRKGLVEPSDPYVIAIDRSDLDFPEFTPLALRVAYGIGNLTLRIPVPIPGEPPVTDSEHESFYQQQTTIAKKSGEAISSMFFLNPVHSGISAIIYSTRGILNLPREPQEMGESFLTLHNPHAMNPVVGLFPFGEEYTGDDMGARLIRPRKEYMRPDIDLYP